MERRISIMWLLRSENITVSLLGELGASITTVTREFNFIKGAFQTYFVLCCHDIIVDSAIGGQNTASRQKLIIGG